MSSADQANPDCSGNMEVEPVTFREKRTADMVKIFLIIIGGEGNCQKKRF